MTTITTEVFFRPEPIAKDETTLPAALYNRCRLMLSRCAYQHIFIPIRSMQFLAVLDEDEVIFVDSQAYAVRDGEGGRMILLSWHFAEVQTRDSLSEPVPVEVFIHHPQAQEVRARLLQEFAKALAEVEERQRDRGCEPRFKKVLPFPS